MFCDKVSFFAKEGPVPEGDYTIPLGQAAVKQAGKDVTLLSYGSGVYLCQEALGELGKLSIDAEVVDLRTLKPLDMALVAESIKVCSSEQLPIFLTILYRAVNLALPASSSLETRRSSLPLALRLSLRVVTRQAVIKIAAIKIVRDGSTWRNSKG